MELTKHIASWSKDKSKKCGAVIVDSENRIVSVGYNGFPSGADDTIEERHERPAKYMYTEHAERNAIYNAARIGVTTKGCTMFIMWFPCADCGRSIIQSGISKLVCYAPDFNTPRWGEQFRVSAEMLVESGITLEYYTDDTITT